MPRKRSPENRGLPARWVFKHGAYYYMVPAAVREQWGGKSWFPLGTNLSDAYRTWASKVDAPESVETISRLLDRYALEVIPGKAPKTQASNQYAIKQLRPVFGDMAIQDLEPQHIYQYVDRRKAKTTGKVTVDRKATVAAHREIEVLSHAYTKAVEWGIIKAHPFKNEVRLKGEAPRDRYVEDWELVEALSLVPMRKKGSVLMIQSYLRVKLLTGLRQSDLLRITLADMKEDGIHVQPHKTAKTSRKKLIYAWTDELKAAIENAKASRPALSPYLFCNRRGECYVNPETDEAHGWKSMWQRYMDRVLEETEVTERFTEHDLRAKVASDAESLKRAQELMAHADSRMTKRVYRRKPELVQPAR